MRSRLKSNGRRLRVQQTLVGNVSFERERWRCNNYGQELDPLDQALATGPHQRITDAMHLKSLAARRDRRLQLEAAQPVPHPPPRANEPSRRSRSGEAIVSDLRGAAVSLTYERMQSHLERLKLKRVAELIDPIAEQAQERSPGKDLPFPQTMQPREPANRLKHRTRRKTLSIHAIRSPK